MGGKLRVSSILMDLHCSASIIEEDAILSHNCRLYMRVYLTLNIFKEVFYPIYKEIYILEFLLRIVLFKKGKEIYMGIELIAAALSGIVAGIAEGTVGEAAKLDYLFDILIKIPRQGPYSIIGNTSR